MELPKIKLPVGKKKKAEKLAGLDIGTFSVKVVVLNSDEKGNLSISAVGDHPLSRGAIVDKDIRDREGIIYAIQTLVDEVDPDITDVVISLAGHKVLIDRVEIPAPTGKGKREQQIREAVMVEAEQRIPTGIDSVRIDFIEIGEAEDKKKIQVMLFAARNEIVEEYVGVVMDAGLVPVVIDLDPIALYNIFEYNHEIPQDECIALVNIGHALSNVSFIVDGKLFSIRDISNAARSVWDRLQTELHLSADDLNQLMRGKIPLEDSPSTRRGVYAACEDLNIGLGMAFSYLENVSGGIKVSRVFLSGGAVAIPFLVDSLANNLGIPCELINSFAKIRYNNEIFGDMPIETARAMYTIATGLAYRGGSV
ncbi:type IV pilus assembly protein PilM [bacterium]|nr:type IV pilus assembly protein PilM [bacterium]